MGGAAALLAAAARRDFSHDLQDSLKINELVTTIIPVRNRAMMLREAVASVLAQTYRPIEVVIVDDGSTDSTSQIADALACEHPGKIRVLWQTNTGPGAARNLGLRHARGEFIQYLDSDDLLEPNKFHLQVAALQDHPEAGVAYGITRRVNLSTGDSCVWARTGETIDQIFPSFLMKRGWDTNAPLWRRSACNAIGPWLELRCLEDWEHDLRAGMLGIRAVHVPQPGAIVRDHGDMRASGMSTGFTPAIVHDMARAHEAVWTRMRGRGLREWSYLEEFSRKVFWIARLCGERGLDEDARIALGLAREMRTGHGTTSLRLYGAAAGLVGWPRTVRWSERGRSLIQRMARR